VSHRVRNFTFGVLLCMSVLGFSACTSEDKKKCVENDDLQACNRECAREDREACAKAELLRARQKQ
jgi:hypothetical protein